MTLRLDEFSAAQLTYPEVGAAAGALPAGYAHISRSEIIGALS